MRFRRHGAHLVWLLTLACTGCQPLSVPGPAHFAETPQALARGGVRITAAGGGGTALFDGSGGGGALRVRVGVGARQEVGVEGEVLAVDTGTPKADDPSWIGKSLVFGYKLSWKLAPRDWVAVVAGVGGAHSVLGESMGGDAGVLFGRPRGIVRPYGGLRALIAAPVGRPLDDRGGLTAGLGFAAGLSFHVARRVDLFAEGGFVWLASTGKERVDLPDMPATDQTEEHIAGYGLAGVAVTLGRAD